MTEIEEFAEHQDKVEPPLSGAPSSKQLRLAEFLANYKGIELPQKCRESWKAWWGWINDTITHVDREDAQEARTDFQIWWNLGNPIEVIRALMFLDKVRRGDSEKIKRDRAKSLIVAHHNPYDVAESFGKDDSWAIELIDEIERATGEIIPY